MVGADSKSRRARRRVLAMRDAAQRTTWSGAGPRIPDRRKQESRRACRTWRYGRYGDTP